MKKIFQPIYLNNRLFYGLFGIGACYLLAFFFPFFMWIAHFLLALICVLLLVDAFLLFQKNGIKSQRMLPEKLSNGDENPVKIAIQNDYGFDAEIKLIDEVPFQFQYRDFELQRKLKKGQNDYFEYNLKPNQRGEYTFGALNVFANSPLGLVSRRFIFNKDKMLPSFPSFIHLPKYELIALKNEFLLGGIKKIRRIGHTMEFEQIKDYELGDDIRNINWKATGKRGRLMVNQYQEERSQRIYMLIDKGRTMKMPFDGLSLLDYAINASMALSHIVLKKNDHAGVMTFARKIENLLPADAKRAQLKKIAETLYNVETNFEESDYSRLYADLRHKVNRRSLILLFTNFETLDALQRQLKYLRGIAKNHLLVVVFFKNKEIMEMTQGLNSESMQDVYDQIIAEKFEYEKKLIRQELQKYGIQSVYTLPENLSISVINKYLEIKARNSL